MSDLRELLSGAAPDPDELDLDRVHRRGRTRRNRTRLAVGAFGVLALVVAVGTFALVSESNDNGQRIATHPPTTAVPPTTTSTLPTTTAPPAVASVVVDDADIAAFVAAVDDTLARQPWEQRCANTIDRFSVGIPAGWYEPTPDPPDPARWAPSGYLSLDFLACKFFGPKPFTICICEPNFGTIEVGSQVPGGYGSSYADAVSNVLRSGSDDHVVTDVSGHEAQCFSHSYGPAERGEGYAASCYIERDGDTFSIAVFVAAPRQEELAADGTVIRSASLPVPEEAREAARNLRDAIVRTVQFVD